MPTPSNSLTPLNPSTPSIPYDPEESYKEIKSALLKPPITPIKSYRYKDGFIYSYDYLTDTLICIGIDYPVLSTLSSSICVADTIKKPTENFNPSNLSSISSLKSLSFPYVTWIDDDSLDSLTSLSEIDTQRLAEEDAMNYLLSLIKENERERQRNESNQDNQK